MGTIATVFVAAMLAITTDAAAVSATVALRDKRAMVLADNTNYGIGTKGRREKEGQRPAWDGVHVRCGCPPCHRPTPVGDGQTWEVEGPNRGCC